MRKIIGVTVGTTLPKPNFDQIDPRKGDYIKGDRSFMDAVKTINGKTPDENGNIIMGTDIGLTQSGVAADAKAVGDALAGKQPVGDYALKNEIPTVPVQSVNGKTGAVNLNASDVGALPDTTVIPSIEGLATETFVAQQIAAIPTPDVSGQISTHNTSTSAHNDMRLLISELATRLNTLANSDDTTLDQMAEIVAYIKNNKSLIDSITTDKVNVSDIINNLTTNVSNKPLSAAQGVALKALIDAKAAKSDLTGLATETYVQNMIETSIVGGEW